MTAARAWLPPGTCHARVEQRIAEAVRDWSCAWMGDEIVDVCAAGTYSRSSLSPGTLHFLARDASLITPANMVALLGQLALGIAGSGDPTETDRPIIESVGREALEDLQNRMVRDLDLEGSGNLVAATPTVTAGQRWTIRRPGTEFEFDLVLSEAQRTRLLLESLPPPPAGGPLDSSVAALASLKVELGASLGRCAISIAELRSLSPGDVLLFDQPLDAALPLAIDGAPTTHGKGVVARPADQLLLQIVEPLYGKN